MVRADLHRRGADMSGACALCGEAVAAGAYLCPACEVRVNAARREEIAARYPQLGVPA
jgi:hypothetical protein